MSISRLRYLRQWKSYGKQTPLDFSCSHCYFVSKELHFSYVHENRTVAQVFKSITLDCVFKYLRIHTSFSSFPCKQHGKSSWKRCIFKLKFICELSGIGERQIKNEKVSSFQHYSGFSGRLRNKDATSLECFCSDQTKKCTTVANTACTHFVQFNSVKKVYFALVMSSRRLSDVSKGSHNKPCSNEKAMPRKDSLTNF